VTCRELDLLLSKDPALPVEAQQHAAGCPRCRNLLRALAVDDAAGELRPALAAGITSRLEAGLRAVRPLPPARYFTAAFALLFAGVAALFGFGLGDHALSKMDWLQTSVTFITLIIAACLLAFSLSAQMTPGSRQLARPWLLAMGVLLGIALVFASIFPQHQEGAFWFQAWRCLRTGLASGALAAGMVWLILRRGAVLDTRAAGALTGLLGGLAGTALLEIHCPDLNGAHILVGHWAAALFGAAIGWLAGGIAANRRA
jgi:hypothetical protein